MSSPRRSTLLLCVVALLLAMAVPAGAATQPEPAAPEPGTSGDGATTTGSQLPERAAGEPAPLLGADHPDALTDRYLVVFRDGSPRQAVAEAAARSVALGGQIHATYRHALQGFAATLPAQALDGVRRNPHVAYVDADLPVRAAQVQSPAPWGLDRIDQRRRPLDNRYHYRHTGSGVSAYILDTGIRRTHVDFGNRAFHGFTAIHDGWGSNDCNGHGTHVAGTVGGTVYGVAKQVRLFSVRVLDCNGVGTIAGVVSGVDWVTANHVKPAVANMSLGGPANTTLDNAVRNSVSAGVHYAVAAGNGNGANACNTSPARVSQALTIGATTSSDARASFSNIGSCVDLFAPGHNITSAWHTSNTATNTISGTSMASPHVAGVVALYLQHNPTASTGLVRGVVRTQSTEGVLSGVGSGSPNRLVYSLIPERIPGSGPCGHPERYVGLLSRTNDYHFLPVASQSNYWAPAGLHQACLVGPPGAVFRLILWWWNGSQWVAVQSVTSTNGNTAGIVHSGPSGRYSWGIYADAGSGTYNFAMRRP